MVTWRPATRKSAPVDGVVVAAHHRMDFRRALGLLLGARISHGAGPPVEFVLCGLCVPPAIHSIIPFAASPIAPLNIDFKFTACTACTNWNARSLPPHRPRIVSHCLRLGKGNFHSSKASYCTPQWHPVPWWLRVAPC